MNRTHALAALVIIEAVIMVALAASKTQIQIKPTLKPVMVVQSPLAMAHDHAEELRTDRGVLVARHAVAASTRGDHGKRDEGPRAPKLTNLGYHVRGSCASVRYFSPVIVSNGSTKTCSWSS